VEGTPTDRDRAPPASGPRESAVARRDHGASVSGPGQHLPLSDCPLARDGGPVASYEQASGLAWHWHATARGAGYAELECPVSKKRPPFSLSLQGTGTPS
jgi:hypothetical protein